MTDHSTDAPQDASQNAGSESTGSELLRTPLHDLHVTLGAKMVPFAGYDMPVQYPLGILKEHLATRSSAGLFDVSHMGQAFLTGDGAAAVMERLTPGDIAGLQPGEMRYTQLLAPDGGILDDLIVSRAQGLLGRDGLFIVVNAACKQQDFAHIADAAGSDARLEVLEDRALIALQGPDAAAILARHAAGAADLSFMTIAEITIDGAPCLVSRSGYTGEDGFEISVPASKAAALASALINGDGVQPVGLGARDSLRLEAGLCLYGHDIDTTTTPVEAGLLWSIGKRRRAEGGFPGADKIRDQIEKGPSRRRVGITPEGRAPAREGTEIQDTTGNGIGQVTSGGFGPSAGGPVAMGYVAADHAAPGTPVVLVIRGKPVPATICKLPFVAHRYYRG